MNNPRVKKPTYSLVTDESCLSFDDPPTVEGSTVDFEFTLSSGQLVAHLQKHCSTEEEARNLIDPYLSSWVIYHELTGRGGFDFRYDSAEVVDLAPDERESGSLHVALTERIGWQECIDIKITSKAYPRPPTAFSLDPDVESMWLRFKGYRNGKEPLPGAAYFCFTVIKTRAGSLRNAANMLNTSRSILTEFKRICSSFGGSQEARKKMHDTPFRQLTPLHRRWIEAVLRQLILRLGRIAAGDALDSKFTMDDLPSLI